MVAEAVSVAVTVDNAAGLFVNVAESVARPVGEVKESVAGGSVTESVAVAVTEVVQVVVASGGVHIPLHVHVESLVPNTPVVVTYASISKQLATVSILSVLVFLTTLPPNRNAAAA